MEDVNIIRQTAYKDKIYEVYTTGDRYSDAQILLIDGKPFSFKGIFEFDYIEVNKHGIFLKAETPYDPHITAEMNIVWYDFHHLTHDGATVNSWYNLTDTPDIWHKFVEYYPEYYS